MESNVLVNSWSLHPPRAACRVARPQPCRPGHLHGGARLPAAFRIRQEENLAMASQASHLGDGMRWDAMGSHVPGLSHNVGYDQMDRK